MKLKELIDQLSEFNPEADVNVIVDNYVYDFSLTWGMSEGSEKENCESVSFYVDELCGHDSGLV